MSGTSISNVFGTVPIMLVVGHEHPDPDVLLSFWLLRRFVPNAAKAELVFVRSGTALEGADDGVVHVDTGGGPFDHHGKKLGRTCSARMLAEALGIQNDPGLVDLLEMVTAMDNGERLPATDIGCAIKALPSVLKDGGKTDWKKVIDLSFMLFDIVYRQQSDKARALSELLEKTKIIVLPNGLRVVPLFGLPRLIQAAFDDGCHVVIWTDRRGMSTGFNVGIQTKLNSGIDLSPLAADLRFAELAKRGMNFPLSDLAYDGQRQYREHEDWYLDEEGRFILRGSRTHPLEPEQRTKLSEREIQTIVLKALWDLPKKNGKEVLTTE